MENLTNLPKIGSTESIRNMGPLARREFRNGLLFISPWIIGFLAFTLIPMLATLVFSFMNLKLTDNPFDASKFVGLKNYLTMFKDFTDLECAAQFDPGLFVGDDLLWV